MNGQEAFEQLCNVLLEELGRVVAPLGVDKAVKRLQLGMAQTVTHGSMTTQAGSFVAQISARQLYVHKKGEDASQPARSVWRSLYEHLSCDEWTAMSQLFGHLARHHQSLTWQDLQHILHFYRDRGWVEEQTNGQQEEQYRLRPFMVRACEDVEKRLHRIEMAVPTIMRSLQGFLMDEPAEQIKAFGFIGSEQNYKTFLADLDKWLHSYLEAAPFEGDNSYWMVLSTTLSLDAMKQPSTRVENGRAENGKLEQARLDQPRLDQPRL